MVENHSISREICGNLLGRDRQGLALISRAEGGSHQGPQIRRKFSEQLNGQGTGEFVLVGDDSGDICGHGSKEPVADDENKGSRAIPGAGLDNFIVPAANFDTVVARAGLSANR